MCQQHLARKASIQSAFCFQILVVTVTLNCNGTVNVKTKHCLMKSTCKGNFASSKKLQLETCLVLYPERIPLFRCISAPPNSQRSLQHNTQIMANTHRKPLTTVFEDSFSFFLYISASNFAIKRFKTFFSCLVKSNLTWRFNI